MKAISASMQAHLRGELTTLAELVKITRQDGQVIALTNHDADIVYDTVTYKAEGTFSAKALAQDDALNADDGSIEGAIGGEQITEVDIEKGLYDHARIDVFVCNWADLTQGLVRLRRGWLGEVSRQGGAYKAQWRDLRDLLGRKVGETYTPSCRYDLGDGRCGVDLSTLKVTGSVVAAEGRQSFTDTSRTEEAGTFNDAVLIWTSGANAGAKIEVYKWDYESRVVTLWLPMNEAIAVGDTYEIAAGCDKRFATCRTRFNNTANFGGFPYLPGLGKLLDYPDER